MGSLAFVTCQRLCLTPYPARRLTFTLTRQALRMGDADDEILRHCEEYDDIGLLVMGSRGLGPIKRRLMGSVSESVVRHSSCPVLVARS
jgi:nucleotide-binding universal stress UspA family protein